SPGIETNLKLTAVKSDLESVEICALLQSLGLFYVKVTGPYWNLVTCGKLTYLGLDKHVGEIEEFLTKCVSSPETLFISAHHWSTSDPLEIAQVPHHARLVEVLFDINDESRDLILSRALLKCIRKQLVDFLHGGKFYQPSADPKPTNFAPLTNLGCEHHFGDLDSSQRRRPNASYHYHMSVQLLKRNRKHVMEWIEKMDSKQKEQLMASARKEGVKLRESTRKVNRRF
ncbi:uncharacterized protein LOC132732765, partial [Ruditapes philippinarum]|uniref:uncharacterized protein LOC132732765 n=1 Tax=Ruditapes philippinarum TaxID=129788 RepID=UPI00295BFDE0